MNNLTTESMARDMGFDEETIQDLLAQGLITADPQELPWRPETREDLNWILAKNAEYDAEEERITVQYQKRFRRLKYRRQWLQRYDADCTAILERELPRIQNGKRTGEYACKSLDLEDGTACLRKAGGKLEVDVPQFLDSIRERVRGIPRDKLEIELGPLLSALRLKQTYQLVGTETLDYLQDPDWTPDLLKTPIAEYLAAHPEEALPGVTLTEVTQKFVIEKPKKTMSANASSAADSTLAV